jgi:CheY-like chemotaxis protein
VTFAGRRVLVVEDDFLVSLATVDFLESIGCEVVGPAASLAAAFKLSQSESLNAAVLDINIAGDMVWPVAEELQRRGVPFIFLSAHSRPSEIPIAFAAVPRLDKPLEQIRLLRQLSAIWDVHIPISGRQIF